MLSWRGLPHSYLEGSGYLERGICIWTEPRRATGEIQSIESSGVTIPEMPWFPRVGRVSRGDFRCCLGGLRPTEGGHGRRLRCSGTRKVAAPFINYRRELSTGENALRRSSARCQMCAPSSPSSSRSRRCTRVPQRWKCSLCVRLWLPACVAARISRVKGTRVARKQNLWNCQCACMRT